MNYITFHFLPLASLWPITFSRFVFLYFQKCEIFSYFMVSSESLSATKIFQRHCINYKQFNDYILKNAVNITMLNLVMLMNGGEFHCINYTVN
jgi:hypothetical protein